MNKQVSDLTFPNVQALRNECLQRCYKQPLAQVTDSEWAGIRALTVAYIKEVAEARQQPHAEDWFHDPCLRAIGQDLRECTTPMPKWAAMASWLSIEGVVKHHPTLVCKIVSLALKGQLAKV